MLDILWVSLASFVTSRLHHWPDDYRLARLLLPGYLFGPRATNLTACLDHGILTGLTVNQPDSLLISRYRTLIGPATTEY
jgi:hypothetical protein